MNIYPFVEQATGIGPMGPSWLRDWFPTLQQMSNAVQLRFDSSVQPINTSDKNELNSGEPADVRPMNISMRQGIGLICASALIAGMLTFLVHWIGGIWSSTYYPISTFTQFVENQNIAESETDSYRAILAQTTRGIGSLRPLWPVWLASGLTALGHWINWPLRWLTVWIVYGFGVLLTSLVLGATTTLQRFYAVTSYASVPLTATILLPIPCIGALAVVASGFWALAIYVMAVHAVTELDFVRTAIAIVAPGAVVLLSLIFALTTVSVFALRLVL
ncbi:YIP1 family protein [Chloroflexi bacterium TSY]|nr:YIP1 family protein [Chloroflexi bacterium TSY]